MRTEAGPPVCIICHNYYPDGHVRRDAAALAAAGYAVSVIALRRPGQPAHEVLNGVEVHRLPVMHQRGSALRYAWEYFASASLAFLTVSRLHLGRRFQVVEVDNMPDVLVFSALLPKLTGVPIIFYIFDNMPELLVTTRGLSPEHPQARLLAWLERLAGHFADRVVVTQEIARRLVEGRGIPASKLSVVLNCPDEDVFMPPPPEARRAPSDHFDVMTHGALLERFGIQVVIEALPRIAAVVPNVRLRIFGEGEYRPALETCARQHGVAERVIFHGFTPMEQLPAILATAQVGYVGMLNDLMLSNKLMEYAAVRVPVVLARWSTYEHYFPEDTVSYFRPGDVDDLVRAVLAIYHDRAAAAERAERANQLYTQSYRWCLQRAAYLGLYEELLTTRGRPSDSPSTI